MKCVRLKLTVLLFLLLFIPLSINSLLLVQSNINYKSTSNKLSDLKSADADSNSNFVVSVEYIDLRISGGVTYASLSLSKNQNVSNCVPFVSMKIDYISIYDWDIILGDIYFKPSLRELTIERSQGAENDLDFYIYIVEFDPTKVKVQQGSFNITDEINIKSINPVNRSKALVLSYWYAANGDSGWDHAMVATNISSDDKLTFQRGQYTGIIYGHYYVLEAQGNEFFVQTADFNFSDLSENKDINKSVDTSKSLVISSYYTTYIGSDATYGACDVWLYDNNTVSAQRHGSSSTIHVIAYVASFSGYETVQRGVFNYSFENSGKHAVITAVDHTHSIVHSPNPYGIMSANAYDGVAYFGTSCARYRFINNNTIEGIRGGPNTEVQSEGHWEVIEWGLIPEFENITPDPDNFLDDFTLSLIILIVSVISAGLLATLYVVNKKYFNLTKFQREIRNLKIKLLNGKFKKNSGLTREDMVKRSINEITSSIKAINKRIKDDEQSI